MYIFILQIIDHTSLNDPSEYKVTGFPNYTLVVIKNGTLINQLIQPLQHKN